MGARISSNLKGSKEETFEGRDDVSESDFSSEMPTWLVSRRLWPPLNCKVVKGKYRRRKTRRPSISWL